MKEAALFRFRKKSRQAGEYQEIAMVQLFIERQATLRQENPLSCFSEFFLCLCLSRTWLDKTIMFDIETSMFTHLKGFCESETVGIAKGAKRPFSSYLRMQDAEAP